MVSADMVSFVCDRTVLPALPLDGRISGVNARSSVEKGTMGLELSSTKSYEAHVAPNTIVR